MGIFDFIGQLVKPISDVIIGLDGNAVKKQELTDAVTKLEIAFSEKVLDYEKQLMQNQTDIIKAEATSANWLTTSWRPITMLTFLFLVVLDSLGWLPFRLADNAWDLLKIGLGGYVIGRSAEKVVPNVINTIKGK